jgi:hypothetical protein
MLTNDVTLKKYILKKHYSFKTLRLFWNCLKHKIDEVVLDLLRLLIDK